jgi:hypothetical protein
MSDAQLADRATTKGPDAVSTFADRATAECSLADVLAANDADIQAWLAGAHPGKTEAFQATFDEPVGRIFYLGTSSYETGFTAQAVLKMDADSPIGHYILTGKVWP